MRYVQDAATEVALEREWHGHVERIWQARLGTGPAIDVCAYDHADVAALGLTIDQLGTALELVTRHDRVVVLDGDEVTEGAPAIRRILDQARPQGTSVGAWRELAAAAARTLAAVG